jgi:hypothetical protein
MASSWPEGLSDREALERLESLLITAIEGNRDLVTEKEYRSLRSAVVARDDLRDVVPQFLRAQRDLTAFAAYIRRVDESRQGRREHVWTSFKPLIDRVEGRTAPKVRSSEWTGRRDASQQARVVLALAPQALFGVEMLLQEQERPLHNGGPVDPEQLRAIESLRELHSALGELIRLAEANSPLDTQLKTVRNVKDAAFRWAAETYELTVAGSPLMTASTVMGCGVMLLVNALTKGSMEAGATMGGGAMAAHALYAHAKRSGARA